MDKTITVLIQTYNEEEEIIECIKSAQLLSKTIVVVDMESRDKTVALAKKRGAVVYSFPFSRYVEPARNFGMEKAKMEWVFLLDADERMTKELASEISQSIRHPANAFEMTTHFKLRRKNIFAGKKWLQYGGWNSPMDYQTRLIKKSAFKNWPKVIHATPVIEGAGGLLQNPLLHYFHKNLETMVAKTAVYEDIESDLLFKARKPVSTSTFFRKFLGELYRRLIKWQGYRDGTRGVIESIYQAYSKTITYLFLYEKYHEKSTDR